MVSGAKTCRVRGRQLDEPLPIAHPRSQEGNFRKRGRVLLCGEHRETQPCSPSEFIRLVNSQAECCRLRYVGGGESIVGTPPALQAILARAAKVARTDSTVLITRETGTGKELVARTIHKRSLRSDRPFVSVNCAAIPSDLIASELFGHEKSAFTGALQRGLGRFEVGRRRKYLPG